MNSAEPQRVAVVITFHCDDRFFPDALASVRAQTRPPDEIVVVDDASPPEKARTLEGLDPDIRVIRHPQNRGAGAARQTGSDTTTAELIAYLDADDSWLPTKLERQLEVMAFSESTHVVHSALITIHRDGSETTFLDKPLVLDLRSELIRNQVLPSSLMLRRSALEAVGGWSPNRRLMEDWDLNTRLVAAGHRVVFIPEALSRFRRVGHGNLSSRGLKNMRILLQTIWHHRRLYRSTLGVRRTIAVAGSVLRHEGFRRGGVSGRMLRLAGRLIGA